MRSPKSEGTQSKNMINFETTTVGIAWKSRGVCFFNDGMLGMLADLIQNNQRRISTMNNKQLELHVWRSKSVKQQLNVRWCSGLSEHLSIHIPMLLKEDTLEGDVD